MIQRKPVGADTLEKMYMTDPSRGKKTLQHRKIMAEGVVGIRGFQLKQPAA